MSVAAWDEQLDLRKKPDTPELLELGVKAALLAPSTHNSQPWRVEIQDSVVKVESVDKKLRSSDPDGVYQWVSIGGFIENFAVCLAYYGYDTKVKIERSSVHLELKLGKPDSLHLIKEITRRYSEKRVFNSKPIEDQTYNKLKQVRGVTYLTRDKNIIEELAVFQHEASKRYKHNKRFARELSRWLKIRSAHEGMHHASSGLTKPQLAIGKSMLYLTPKVLEKMAIKYHRLTIASNAVGFISAQDKSVASLLQVGRSLERLALTATQAGLSLTALAAIVEDVEGKKFLKELQQDVKQEPIIFFRLSDRKEPVYHTVRKPYKMVVRS